MSYQDDHKYDDIINLPHHVSKNRPHMELIDRAAQFSPFAALTGHDAAIQETTRLTDERIELDENSKEMLDEKLQRIREHLPERPKVTITYFEPDKKKEGGSYVTVSGQIKKIDEYEGKIVLESGEKIPISEIVGMEEKLLY